MREVMRFFLLLAALATAPGLTAEEATASYVQLSGKALYERFCASCHGLGGRGDGKVAESLNVEVPDLTLLARRARGHYPAARVSEVIDGRVMLGAHGTRTMPVWGQEFWTQEGADSQAEFATRAIIDRLVSYIATLQRPPLEPTEE